MSGDGLGEYLKQLEQVSVALTLTPDNEELKQLASSLKELIELTEQHEDEDPHTEQPANGWEDNAASRSLDDEMALFQSEIAAVERADDRDLTSSEADSPDGDTEQPPEGADDQRRQTAEELKASLQGLVGARCSAPFTQAWGQLEYHAAIVEAVDDASLEDALSADDVKVRVLFSHPTQRVMQPCKYYMRHTCDYGDECRFSHGHLVSVCDIREYSDAVSGLSPGAAVLVRRDADSGLWQRAALLSLEPETEQAAVRLGGDGRHRQVPLAELVPLPGAQPGQGGGGDVSSSDSEDGSAPEPRSAGDPDPEEAEFCPRVTWEDIASTGQLGSWEKHTKGVGSRLLRQMGYVTGTGLGPLADGRVEPVEARVYPAGRSLDHCMALREGGAGCLLTVERRLEREQRRQEKIGRRAQRPGRGHAAMFDVINRATGTPDHGSEPAAEDGPVRSASRAELNLRDLRVGEQIRDVERHIARLEAGWRRNAGGALGADLRARLDGQRQRLAGLRSTERSIQAEKRQRTGSKRLDVF
ncbi:zinc finger CCCH-type with G patch domain-containing protein-like [Pollicipes pollicipes]|uniref:zinc finger CCCH-type with G patch domain-containing protein-like n=1 Tax=Pollicipes pollicipes TaxID=41117 RepID=UPI001884CAAA|nr:zinc finger CCCH-type with G patch domain-containing protein-like [Pollicipes pollicipes]